MKDLLMIGDKGMGASLAAWGIMLLVLIAVILAVVASTTGGDDRRSPSSDFGNSPSFFD